MGVLTVEPDAKSGVRVVPSLVLGYPSLLAAGVGSGDVASVVARLGETSGELAEKSWSADAEVDVEDAARMERQYSVVASAGMTVAVHSGTSASIDVAEEPVLHTYVVDHDQERLQKLENSIEEYGR